MIKNTLPCKWTVQFESVGHFWGKQRTFIHVTDGFGNKDGAKRFVATLKGSNQYFNISLIKTEEEE